ncbi:methylated-DNA--[protein]-cysteine S-methyltransferase [Falsihalocynthiibacter sp. BN13B15]|uniref:methylated-DNA--[protein]-cysteine S-methyltransferase n=1 Tax=Falsihalocynthiibacter sp. BN13B15 TaxID=3240871 RepID=UPI00350FC9C0
MIESSVLTSMGTFGLIEDEGAIIRLTWHSQAPAPSTDVSKRAADQLSAYFDGGKAGFDLPLRPSGSAFQQKVNAAMRAIPYGETRTYGEIAKDIGASAQAVGNACGTNSIPVIIPCHRVLGAQGLGGFSGEGAVETKVKLLIHEGAAGLLI